MKKSAVLILTILLLSPFFSQFKAIGCDILYFCEDYTSEAGEINCSDLFYVGNVNVMVSLESAIYYTNVKLQLDKFDPRSNDYVFYNDYEFEVNGEDSYINFGKIYFGDKGFYRVFLLDPYDETITSTLIEII